MLSFLINLPGDVARWEYVARQFDARGLQAERLAAVRGADLTALERRQLYSPRLNRIQYHKALRPGEIGCYASHIAAWQQLIASGERAAVIFEDDIDVDADLPQILDAVLQAPCDWDLVKLIGRARENPRERMPLLPGRDLIAYRRVPSLTGAYIVSRRGAEKLLERRMPFGRPIDVDLRHWWECDLRILGVDPYPVRGAPSSRFSTIEDRSVAPQRQRRLARIWLQLRYTVLNVWANWHAKPLEPRRERGRSAALPRQREWPAQDVR